MLQLINISKSFGVVKALRNISLDIPQGETIALVGQNGAGKSTLVKILTGAYQMDSGEIRLDGKTVKISNTASAKEIGIAQVYQRAELIPEFTVAENIAIGEKSFSSRGLVKDRVFEKSVQQLLDRFSIPLNAKTKVNKLSGAMQQMVAIAKVLYQQPKYIIWDEPTAVLSDKEVNILFNIINESKRMGITMIYISHRLDEIFQICENVAVMRDGELVSVMRNKGLTKDMLIEKMLGRSLNTMYAEKKHPHENEVVLEVDHLTTNKVKDISFKLFKGEILGIAGLVNSGRTETVEAIFGLDKVLGGSITINGKKVHIRNSKEAVKNGMFLAPEDRKGKALALCRPIRENVSLSNMSSISRFGIIKKKEEKTKVNDICRKLAVKAESIESSVDKLSGGNQQKVVVAKAILAQPEILVFDEPTQGIDVGAKAEIFSILENFRTEGRSILVISSEIEEIQKLCDRAIVLHEGRLTGEVEAESLQDTEQILQLMYRRV